MTCVLFQNAQSAGDPILSRRTARGEAEAPKYQTLISGRSLGRSGPLAPAIEPDTLVSNPPCEFAVLTHKHGANFPPLKHFCYDIEELLSRPLVGVNEI